MSIGERAKLLLLLGRRGLRMAAGRLRGHPFIRLSFIPRKAERLLIAPQDLRTADGTRASEIYAGRFAFAGKVVISDGRSPFDIAAPSDEWAASLLGFGWLRHLRAAESGITRANARALVDEWISVQGAWDPVGWQPEILARRVIAWLSQAPLILHDADDAFYRRFLRSLVRQVRYLRHTAIEAREGVPRMQALVALTYAALCMSGQARHMRGAVKQLVAEIDEQILVDGGHISRNPGALIELLLDLLPLRHAFAARNIAPPPQLNNAIDRMMPMMRFFRHGDGNFAHFNGMGPTLPDVMATILAYDDARGAPLSNAPHSGYQRAQAGEMVVLMDAGAPPPINVSQEAHAGCLSFEMSHGLQRIVVNCGLPGTNKDSWRQVARATAAHSTVVFNDTSSCRFLESGSFKGLLGTPIVSGPTDVQMSREDRGDGTILRASHNGYGDRFKVLHQRALKLSTDGTRLDGEDFFVATEGDLIPQDVQDEFAVRFHLHPTIKANKLTDGHGAMLMLPTREVWTFNAYEDRVEIEESVYLSGSDGPRRAVQIVIYGRARRVPRVHWSLALASAQGTGGTRRRGEDPQLPLTAP
ncbi:heparinase II/III family protein [Rhodoplanes sp. Z2-YC6860]|uniref:heparinase II/III family protein n=1 Tax=Rhodoplanes sp. Z2-YC6860 TaxID=674703 RepID=UPI003FA76856